ncbi:MAG: HlyD family secretion protein [Fimbriimonadaceae bacterium]
MAEQTDRSPSAPNGAPTSNGTPKPKIALIVVLLLVLVGAVFAYRTWSFNQSHAATDDSQVAADSVDVSPQVGGTVEKVLVADNQLVKQGDLLVQIDDRSLVATLAGAEANLDAAIAQAKGAGVTVNLTRETGSAQIHQAEGVVAQADAGISSAQSDVLKAQASIAGAQADQGSAQANIAASESGVATANAAVRRARAALKGAQAVVDSARAQVKASDAVVATAQANADFTEKDAARYQSLVGQGAVSHQEADAKQAAADSAAASLEAARQQADVARAGLLQRQAELASAEDSVSAAQAGVRQARADVAVSHSKRAASDAAYRSALAQRQASADAVRNARARAAQAQGQLAQAQTSGTSVDVSQTAKLQATAKVEQARAAVEEAKLQLSYTKIYAPRSGRVTKKNVDVGQILQAGSPILTLVDESSVWVVANFKETQMPGIHVGNHVDIEIDAVPNHTYSGVVNSIQAGTGAAFTLLPPDNATGNFTKVVQRIPVKITFEPRQSGLDQIRTGMSANVIVRLSGK